MSDAPDKPIRAGIFESESSADRAVAGLLAAGFAKERISVVSARPMAQRADHPKVDNEPPAGAHTAGAIAAGGAIGSVLGGLTVVVGVAATGGLGLLAVGPLLGAAATGGVFGSFVGAMLTRGLEEETANYFDQALTQGQYLVSVEHVEGEGAPPLEAADAVFQRAGVVSLPLRKG
jgi:hypothetical protein